MSDQRFMRMAQSVARLSQCRAVQVGAVLVVKGEAVATGYNATPLITDGCMALGYCRPGHSRCTNPGAPPSRAVHAEVSAIASAARRGIPTQGAELFCTLEPCLSCLKLIVAAGVARVVYGDPLPVRQVDDAEWRSLVIIDHFVEATKEVKLLAP